MSSHAKKRKVEAMRNISQPFNSDNSFFDFVDRLRFKYPSTPVTIVSTITSNSIAPANMKMDEYESYEELKEGARKTIEIEDHGSSPPCNVL